MESEYEIIPLVIGCLGYVCEQHVEKLLTETHFCNLAMLWAAVLGIVRGISKA